MNLFILTRTALVIVLYAGMIVLQVFLSKRESKWAGLVLPAISFLVSLIVALNVTAAETLLATIATVFLVLLLANIPTLILLAIYFGCRKKYRRKDELDKMSIQDLE